MPARYSVKNSSHSGFQKVILSNAYFYPLLCCSVLLCSYVNYSSTTMSGLLPYYLNFADLIRAGIFNSSNNLNAGTFPMWGYGFVFALTQNKLLIIVMQQLLNLAAIYLLDNYLKKKRIGERAHFYFRILLLLSFPVYFMHSILWPNSFSSSLVILAVLSLVKFLENPEFKQNKILLLLSAICFGIALNFRSDYLLLLFSIYGVTALYFILIRKNIARRLMFMTVWIFVIILLLLPWAIYSKKTSGHYLLTSTNTGHVLYVALGQLPGNKWHIEPFDDDSSMKQIVEEKLHPANYSSVTYEADSVLKKAWIEKVSEHPAEYLKKCAYNMMFFFIQPFSEGDGYKDSFTKDDLNEARDDIREMKFFEVYKIARDHASIALFLSLFTSLFSVAFIIFFWITVFRNLKNIPRIVKRNKLLGLSLLIILYQVALQSAGYYHRHYNTNIYLLYLIVIIILMNNAQTRKHKLTVAYTRRN